MSRHYEMRVQIVGHRPENTAAIQEAAAQEWPFVEWFDEDETLTAWAEDNLYGGEREEEFTDRLAVAIWRANGAYCAVTVDATYLEELPFETHCLDEDDYARLLAKHEQPYDAQEPSSQ